MFTVATPMPAEIKLSRTHGVKSEGKRVDLRGVRNRTIARNETHQYFEWDKNLCTNLAPKCNVV
jgi:hypothetical protein